VRRGEVIVAWRRDAVGFCMVVHRLIEVSVHMQRMPAPLESVATGVLVIYIFLDNYFHSV
jgi:hypothetical protein